MRSRRWSSVASALVAAALASAAQPAAAANGDSVQCAPGDAWCIAVFHKFARKIVFFDIAGFKIAGQYQVCVTPPRRKERCRTYTLHRIATGANASSVQFTKNFPHSAHGVYRVRWIYEGKQLGRTLRFRY